MNTCEQAPSELLGAGLPVLLGLVQGPDHVPGVELGVARDDVAAAHHAVTHLLQTVQNLRKAVKVIIDDRCLRFETMFMFRMDSTLSLSNYVPCPLHC